MVVSYIQCNQTDLASVEAGMERLSSATEALDILICNAGVMGTDPALTKDGSESQLGINHLAHALMVKMLLPSLQRAATQKGDARIVFLSSTGFRWTPSGGIVFKDLKSTQDYAFAGCWVRYGQSKLANVVYAAELTRRYLELTSVAVHPGVIWTELHHLSKTMTGFKTRFANPNSTPSIRVDQQGVTGASNEASTARLWRLHWAILSPQPSQSIVAGRFEHNRITVENSPN
ncbi:MAG: hypothetical protein M1816_007038 [Peltula sp. TS41687]|nr:MAG: hypothetical protein M1816_007038 [Peltula sp. TS41687]